MTRTLAPLCTILLAAPLILACGSDSDSSGTDAGPTNDGGPDAGPGTPGTLAQPVTQSGVTYLAHFLPDSDTSNKLAWYRTDGATSSFGGSIEVDNPTQAMALDPRHDLLAIASDVGNTVTLYRVSRPASEAAALAAPAKAGVISYANDELPVSVFFNDVDQRLYVAVSPAGGADIIKLHAYDSSTPDAPSEISGSPYDIPLSVYLEMDSSRRVLFLGGLKDKELHVYDLDDNGLSEIGASLDLPALYPEPADMPSNVAFQVRHVTTDPWNNRVYATRSQGILSELIAFEYPAHIPNLGARYGDTVDTAQFTRIADGFDTSLPGDQRQNLLEGYGLGLDTTSGDVYMLGNAWNGAAATAIALNFKASDLSIQPGCEDFESFGCFIRTYIAGQSSAHLQTDGAACFDSTHKVFTATALAADEDQPGEVLFLKAAADGSMAPMLDDNDDTLTTSPFPIAAICH